MTMFYMDRWGQNHAQDRQKITRGRSGAFAAIMTDTHILLTWPKYNPGSAELPGGGLEPNENACQAVRREILEETGFVLPPIRATREYTHQVKYYAEDVQEFWDYTQKYFVFHLAGRDTVNIQDRLVPTDADRALWVPRTDLNGILFHAVHKKTLKLLECWPASPF